MISVMVNVICSESVHKELTRTGTNGFRSFALSGVCAFGIGLTASVDIHRKIM
jgi:hypothetical protein